MKRYILGAGEQGKIMLPYIMESSRIKPDGFFDDYKTGKGIIGKFSDLEKILTPEDELYLGIGDNYIRGKIYQILKNKVKFPSLVHDSAIIASNVKLGEAVTIAPGVIINPLSKIGNGCIINTGAIIEHETEIGDFSNMEPASRTMGGVKIGNYTIIGPGAVIAENIKVGNNCHIGMLSAVNKDIPDNKAAWGIPTRVIRENKQRDEKLL